MSWVGGLLLFSGWAIAIAAILLFTGLTERVAFVLAGFLVELLGLGLLGRSFTLKQRVNFEEPFRGTR